MSLTGRLEPLLSFLLVIHVGAYIGRARTAISHYLNVHGNKKAKIQLRLIVSDEFSTADTSYEENFVRPLLTWIEQTWKQVYPQIIVETVHLRVTDIDHCTPWLVETLCSFFKENPRNSYASVDLTSSPVEWYFAAMDVCRLFDNMEFTYVRPAKRRLPRDFSSDERDDPGVLFQQVATGVLAPPLRYWLSFEDEKGCPTEHHVLFQTLWDLSARAKGKALPFDDIARTFKEKCLHAYGEALSNLHRVRSAREKQDLETELESRMKRLRGMGEWNIKKKIARYVTDIEPYGILEHTLGAYEFTEKGAALAKVLFFQSSEHAP